MSITVRTTVLLAVKSGNGADTLHQPGDARMQLDICIQANARDDAEEPRSRVSVLTPTGAKRIADSEKEKTQHVKESHTTSLGLDFLELGHPYFRSILKLEQSALIEVYVESREIVGQCDRPLGV